MAANRGAAGPWEKLRVENNGDGTVSFKAWNGKYVMCHHHNKKMTANARHKKTWEKFRIEKRTDCEHGAKSCIAIKASNGKYVRADSGSGNMWCKSNSVGGWEKFYGWK